MKKLIFFLLSLSVILTSCSTPNNEKHDGLILTDVNTGKRYLLNHNFGNNYFIDEEVEIINGQDTTYQFK